MPHINKQRPNTRLQIIQLAANSFIEKGYTKTSTKKIAEILDLSPGNITFYFPTKDHLLAVVVDELFDFQQMVLEKAANEGKTSLLAYCLELATIAAICEEDEAARDFFVSAYASELTLELIRENDTEKTKKVFAEFHPDWSDEQWEATENIVSGIEYATLVTREEKTPLPIQIENALNSIMLLYGVPDELRKIKIDKVLNMDYRAISRGLISDFREYIKTINEDNLKKAIREKNKKKKK